MTAPSRSLRRTLAKRFVVIAAGALLLQLGYVIYVYDQNPGDLIEAAIELDMDRLAAAIPANAKDIIVPEDLAARYARFPNGYGFELRGAGDGAIASYNAALFAGIALSMFADGREAIIRDSLAGIPRVVGARSVTSNGSNYVIRVASVGDPAGLQTKVLISEVFDHVMLPIVPMTLLLFAAMWVALDRSLSLIEATAKAVSEADPAEGGVRLNLDRAPAEIAVLVKTVNALLDRLDEVIKSHHDFAANVAHELRTPLSLIMLDLENSPDPSTQRARAEAQSMARLIDQLLSMSRLEGFGRSGFADMDLSLLARSVAARLAPTALDSGVEVEVIAPAKVVVRGHAEMIEGAIRNLVENAVRVTPPGSSVEILVDPGRTISVRDHGPGIAADQIAGLFERHRQGDRRTRGAAGLGLEITNKTIELHGGHIEVTSDPGKGSTFTLHFPDSTT